ncbi:MAG: DUF3141 domain-containing protein [Elusimicrobia bacterium]|nr:DUF3141 domain-containing protein [Elusimicrobiota bacterium]
MLRRFAPLAAALSWAALASGQMEVARVPILTTPLLGSFSGAAALGANQGAAGLSNTSLAGPSPSLDSHSLSQPPATILQAAPGLSLAARPLSAAAPQTPTFGLSAAASVSAAVGPAISLGSAKSLASPAPAATLPDVLSAFDDGRRRFDGDALRLDRDAYAKAKRPLGFFPPRTPWTNFFIHWTAEQKALQRLGRQMFVRPMVEGWVAQHEFWKTAAAGTPLEPWVALWAPMSDHARRFKLVLDFIDRVESAKPKWSTENRIVLDRPSFALRDFSADKRFPVDRKKTPAMIIPPNSGHLSTIADFDDGKSVVQTFAASKRATFSLDWKSAVPDNPQMIADMVQDVVRSIDAVGGKVQLVGLCQGGWLAAIVAALYPEKVEALYLAGAPIDATRGDNDVTRAAGRLPIEFYNWMVYGMGRDGVYDGESQLEGFLNIGADGGHAKRFGFWQDLMQNIDDKEHVARAERFATWFYAVNNLSLWYLEAVEKLFKENQLYRGVFELGIDGKTVRVDLSRITVPIVMFEGAKDDITARGQTFALGEVVRTPEALQYKRVDDVGHIGLYNSERIQARWRQAIDWVDAARKL